jgi:drug/metabolite transporter (DMT)-like permease
MIVFNFWADMNKTKFTAYLAWFSTCIVWGTTYLAIRIGVTDLPPLLFAGLRWIAAGSLFFLVLKLYGLKAPALKELKHLAIVGIALIGIGNGLVVFAEQWIPSGLAALILTTLPIWVVVLEMILPGKRKFNIKSMIGLILGLAGTSLIFHNELENLFNPDYFIGIIAIFGAIISWGAGSLYSKHRKFEAHPLMNASVQMMIAGAAQTIVGLSLGEASRFVFTQDSLYAFLYLLFVGSLLGYASYIYALSHLPASFATTYAYINPIIALYLGWLVLDENLSLNIIAATVIIIVGVIILKKGTEESIPTKKSKVFNRSTEQ